MKEDLRETIKYRGYDIDTYYDTDPPCPDEWDDEIFLVYDHRDFFVERKGFNPDDIFERMQDNKKTYDGYWFFPVYAYIHSGVALSLGRTTYPFTCRWDTSFKGFALIKRNKYSWTESKAYKRAEGLIESWNMYLSGDVYGYNSECGSCWGFYGEEGYKQMIEEAKREIDYEIEEKRKEYQSKLKTLIRNRAPYSVRQTLLNGYDVPLLTKVS
jgi:hypothetical protein